jgi:hypothetical protein
MKGPTSKLRKFSRLTSADQWLLVRAALWLGVARTLLATMSFDRLSEHLVEESGKTGTQPDREFVDRVGYAVRAAAGAVPWRADCFPQTIAARMLLRREGYATTIHLGVRKDGERNIAGHAWLTCEGMVVTGGEELDRYTEMHRINT